jgi:hypothetical protein
MGPHYGSWPLLVKVAKGPKLGGIPSRGGKALRPAKKTDADACFTKSGQEPKLFATEQAAKLKQ